jgi:hypothetical protein
LQLVNVSEIFRLLKLHFSRQKTWPDIKPIASFIFWIPPAVAYPVMPLRIQICFFSHPYPELYQAILMCTHQEVAIGIEINICGWSVLLVLCAIIMWAYPSQGHLHGVKKSV